MSPPVPAHAQNNVLRIPCNELPPWKILSENGTCSGIDVELTEEIVRRLGLKTEYIPCPFNRCLKMMKFGDADLMTGLLRRPEREEYMRFLDPPYKNSTDKAFYTRAGEEKSITEYDNLHRLRIGIDRGSKYHPRFDADTTIIKDDASSDENNFQKLIRGRVDAVIITESSGEYFIRRLGLTGQVAKAPFGFRKRQDVYMAVSNRSPYYSISHEIEAHLRDLARENALEAMKKKFMNGVGPASSRP